MPTNTHPFPSSIYYIKVFHYSVWSAKIKHHRLGDLNNRKIFLTVLGVFKSKIQGLADLVSPKIFLIDVRWSSSCYAIRWIFPSGTHPCVPSFSCKDTTNIRVRSSFMGHLTLITSFRTLLPSYIGS
jgi:hypothetical protein